MPIAESTEGVVAMQSTQPSSVAPENMHSRWGTLGTNEELLAAQKSDGFCRIKCRKSLRLVNQLIQELTSRRTAACWEKKPSSSGIFPR